MCSKNDTVCRGCCEELTVGGMQLCAYREVCAGIEGGVDSSAKIHKANINTNRQGHLNDRICVFRKSRLCLYIAIDLCL